MLVQDYVELALRSEVEGDSSLDRLDHAAMGLVTDVGELVDALKKHKRYGREFDLLNFCEELGDVAWYAALAADVLGLNFPDMLAVPHHKEMAMTAVGVNLTQIGLIDFNTGLLVHHAAEFFMIVRRMRYIRRTVGHDLNKLTPHLNKILHTIEDLAQLGGFTLENVLDANIAKLMRRYSGKFTAAEAEKRDIEAEKKALADALVDAGIDPAVDIVTWAAE